MKYIKVIEKKTGKEVKIMAAEWDAKRFAKKEDKVKPATKEDKTVQKRKTK